MPKIINILLTHRGETPMEELVPYIMIVVTLTVANFSFLVA